MSLSVPTKKNDTLYDIPFHGNTCKTLSNKYITPAVIQSDTLGPRF